MTYYNGCPYKKAKELNEERKFQNEDKRQDQLDSIGETQEERHKFLQDLVNYFDNNKMKDAYHYIVKEEVVSYFLTACKLLNCKISKYHCQCETRDDKPHRHMVVWLPNPTNVKKPSQKLSRMVAVVMKKNNMTQGNQKRMTFGIRIKSRAHLLNVVLYIQTSKTNGHHSGTLKDCTHFGHRIPTVIPDKKLCKYSRKKNWTFCCRNLQGRDVKHGRRRRRIRNGTKPSNKRRARTRWNNSMNLRRMNKK
jgi:hypothetical protein